MANDGRKVVKVEVQPGCTTTHYDDGTVDWDLFDMPEILTDRIEQAAKEKGISFEEEVIGRLREAVEQTKRQRAQGGNRWESS